jgi:hypothetical protein
MLTHLETKIHAKQEQPIIDKHINHQTDKQIQEFHNHQELQQQNQRLRYNINLQYNPQTPGAGNFTKLTIYVTEQESGDVIQEFENIHDKLMHIIIVGEDLSYFAHIHPTLEMSDSNFTINHIFPESGKYKIWVDFKPRYGIQTIVAFKLNVTGSPVHNLIALSNNKQYTRDIDGKYQVSLTIPKEIRANEDVDVTFNILDAFENPITDLEPLMGAGGHSVIVSRDVRQFLHVHPSKEVQSNWRGGPAVSFKTRFTYPGLYKVWGQFQHQGRIITADFILEVV